MLFKITELKKFLSSTTKYKIENIYIKSNTLELVINTTKQKNHSFINKKLTYKPINEYKINKNNEKIQQNNEKIQQNNEKNTYFTIVSPMIGTFYRSPAPNELPFIQINDMVKINQTVCIIEAMKLMNEIESEVNGHIVEILVEDGDIVDCGQALMRVQQQ